MRRLAALVLCVSSSLVAQDPTDAQHARLDVELNPTTQTIAGSCDWTVRSTGNGLTAFTLQLHSGFAVTNVRVNGLPATSTRPVDAVAVTLDRPYNQDETFTVGLDYSGPPAGGGFGSWSWGTHGTPATPMISSLSEPYYAYTWWPVKESNTDKFTTETRVTVPDPLYVASNGVLQGTDALSGGRTRYRWASNYPIATYGVAITATNYQIRTDTYTHLGASMPVSFYAYPESFASQQAGMDRLVPMLTVFSNLFGQFPFVNEKYGICQFNWGGGMEHQTITSQVNFGENLSAHELAHSWWGNSITCATWHDIGLNEGFATYGEALWDEFKTGGGVSAYFSRMNANKPSNPGTTGSVYVADISNVNAIFSTTNVYRKGAWVLHQLRHVVGDTAFFQILRDYRAAKDYGSATWAEFRAIAAASAGQDLDWLLDPCVTRPGAPAFSLAWSAQSIAGQEFVFGSIQQTQTAAAWRFPVDIRVTDAGGQATSVVWNDQKRDDFILPRTGTATAVALDPGPWILRNATTTAAWTPSLTASPASIPRTGGTVTLTLNAGTQHANRPYLVGGSGTGVWPGATLPDGKRVPLVIDGLTVAILQGLGGPVFQDFAGMLSATGQATARIVLPPLPPIAGPVTAWFAAVTTSGPVFTSIPVAVTITP